jgi:UDP-N-acetylmuramate dehydrogenase
MLNLSQDFSLLQYNSFGIDAYTKYFYSVKSVADIRNLVFSDIMRTEKHFVIGSGSNILFKNDYEGLIISVDIHGLKVVEKSDTYIIIEAGAGENWHNFVEKCVNSDYYGLENLALIPGKVGAAPVQNIGAYGAEQKDFFHSLTAFDIDNFQEVELSFDDCHFAYRDSIFKHIYKNKFIVTAVRYKLSLIPDVNISYKDILDEIEKTGIINPNSKFIFNTVCKIRNKKLPNPSIYGNAGSFFKNPIIDKRHYNKLKSLYPDMPSYVNSAGKKIPAAYLIEKAGLKGSRVGEVGVSPNHSLILINYGRAKGEDIYNFSEMIIQTVKKKFDITLEREVIVV